VTPTRNAGAGTSAPASGSVAVSSVTVTGVAPLLGLTSQFTATALLTNGTTQGINSLATWGSSNTPVATVNSAGLVLAAAAGSADITATYQGTSASAHLTIAPPTFTVSGFVTDGTSGGILPKIDVQIVDSVSNVKLARTDNTGFYSIAGVAAGALTVTASATSYQTYARAATITADTRINVVLPRAVAMVAGTITFDGIGANGSSVTSYSEGGFSVVPSASANWTAVTTYGHPAPFIEFNINGGVTVVGEVNLSANGAPFLFTSIDIYSSTTPIPYVIRGVRNSATVYTLAGTIPNTFGNFATISNSHTDLVDTVIIDVTNAAAPCCRNPVGIDTIVIAK
jgi:hypothetical protein